MKQRVILAYKLLDHADGVRGHYCVGRQVDIGDGFPFWEFWTGDGWGAAGKIYYYKSSALIVMNAVKEASNV